jgi:small subunit ribosomal protein S5
MTDTMTMPETEVQNTPVEEVATPEVAVEATPVPTEAAPQADQRTIRGRSDRSGGGRPRGRERAPRERSEFDSVTIAVRRVARVMAGGRRFSFSVALVLGDKKGRVGVGLGKAGDTALAIDKATRDAKKNMITVLRTPENSIPYSVTMKYSSSTIEVRPSPGRGVVAGSAMRTVLELAGVTDVVTKIHTRTKNKLTIARATVAALDTIRSK